MSNLPTRGTFGKCKTTRAKKLKPRGKNLPSRYLKSGDDAANVAYVNVFAQIGIALLSQSYSVTQYIGNFDWRSYTVNSCGTNSCLHALLRAVRSRTPWDAADVRMRTLVNRTIYDVLLHSSCVCSIVLCVRVLHGIMLYDRIREQYFRYSGTAALHRAYTPHAVETCMP